MGYFKKVKDKVMKDMASFKAHKEKYDAGKIQRQKMELDKLKREEKVLKAKVGIAKKKKELSKYRQTSGLGFGEPMFKGTMDTKTKEWSIGEKEKGWKIGEKEKGWKIGEKEKGWKIGR